MMEVVVFYVLIMYCNEMESYIVTFIVGIGLVLIVGNVSGDISIIALCMIWPIYQLYIVIIGSIYTGVNVLETVKNCMVLMMLGIVTIYLNSVLYICVVSGVVGGFLSVIALGVYVYLIVGVLWVVLVSYVFGNCFINVSHKILVLSVLPLPVFFLNVISSILIYVLMFFGVMVFIN